MKWIQLVCCVCMSVIAVFGQRAELQMVKDHSTLKKLPMNNYPYLSMSGIYNGQYLRFIGSEKTVDNGENVRRPVINTYKISDTECTFSQGALYGKLPYTSFTDGIQLGEDYYAVIGDKLLYVFDLKTQTADLHEIRLAKYKVEEGSPERYIAVSGFSAEGGYGIYVYAKIPGVMYPETRRYAFVFFKDENGGFHLEKMEEKVWPTADGMQSELGDNTISKGTKNAYIANCPEKDISLFAYEGEYKYDSEDRAVVRLDWINDETNEMHSAELDVDDLAFRAGVPFEPFVTMQDATTDSKVIQWNLAGVHPIGNGHFLITFSVEESNPTFRRRHLIACDYDANGAGVVGFVDNYPISKQTGHDATDDNRTQFFDYLATMRTAYGGDGRLFVMDQLDGTLYVLDYLYDGSSSLQKPLYNPTPEQIRDKFRERMKEQAKILFSGDNFYVQGMYNPVPGVKGIVPVTVVLVDKYETEVVLYTFK